MRSINLNQIWQEKINLWLDRRIPPAHLHQLNMRSIFILPSAFGWMFIALCVCLFLLGTNYQNNVMLLLCFLLVAIFLINLHASYWNFARLCLSLGAIPPGYQDDHVDAKLTLADENVQHTRFNGVLTISDYKSQDCLSIDCQNCTAIKLPILLEKRGVHQLPRITLSSVFPFGLYRCWTHIDFDRQLIVYPRPMESELNLHSAYQDPDNSDTGSSIAVAGNEDFTGLKPYIAGDSLNRISWKHVAKQQQWVSKSFESEATVIGWLKLPIVPINEIEIALSKLAFQINLCTRRNIAFGLDLGTDKIDPNSGDEHRKNCLLALARYPQHGAREE